MRDRLEPCAVCGEEYDVQDGGPRFTHMDKHMIRAHDWRPR